MSPDRCVLGRDCPSLGVSTRRRQSADLDTEDARAEAVDRRRLEHDLRLAASAGSFVLHYAPRVALATGAITGAEAVIRWPHRKRGLIAADRFMPQAEQIGLTGSIGGWMLLTGCTEAAAWPDSRLTLSLPISPRHLHDAAFLADVAAAARTSGLPAERIVLELTESTLLAVDDDMLFLLSALRDLGVGLALDDFGTGYASLAMLRRLPLTTLKIDRSLIRELPGNREDAAIVRAVVATTHAMGLTVTADGVESEDQRDFLARSDADDAQGTLFGRPGPAERLRECLRA